MKLRKLNKNNKIFITILAASVLLIFSGIILFIVYKVKELNIRYDVTEKSSVYNTSNELVYIENNTYAKKNLLGNYYVVVDEDKVSVGSNPVIYNEETKDILLLGTFFEIMANGEINKLKGETIITSSDINRIYKIDDRKYLIIGNKITTKDGALNTTGYLLVNIDKKGNAYVYNQEGSHKTFSELVIATSDYEFNVNTESLIRDGETIDLSKINGSTNEYVAPEVPDNTTDNTTGEGGSGSGEGEGDGEGSGSGSGNGTGEGGGLGENIYPEGNHVVITGTVLEQKYISRKTSIIGLETTTSEIKINYIVYDPFSEFKSLYVVVTNNGQSVGTYEMNLGLTNHTLSGLRASENYELNFYYSFVDNTGTTQNVLFDTLKTSTKSINASITLEKISPNSVRYIVKVEGGYVLDSANVALYIDGVLVNNAAIDTVQAASKTGYTGEINYDANGNFAILRLTDCVYQGEVINTSATYKYKI